MRPYSCESGEGLSPMCPYWVKDKWVRIGACELGLIHPTPPGAHHVRVH